MGKRFLNTLANIFGKKSENIKIADSKTAEVTRTNFNHLATKLSTNLLAKGKKDNRYYVKSVYKGKIQDPTELNSNYDKTNTAAVFVLSNGGRVYLISITDEDGITSQYVGTNNPRKANDFFSEFLGMSFDLYLASKRLLRKKLKKYKIDDKPKVNFNDTPKEKEPEIKEPQVKKSFGVINTNVDTHEQLVDKLGNGRVGYGLFKNAYKYNNLLKRQPFENNWGRGYKYTLSNNMEMYLLKSIENPDNTKILFNNKLAYSRAINLNMLPWFNPGTKIQWQELDIDNI